MRDCPKDLSKTGQKVSLNAKEGMKRRGAGSLRNQKSLSQYPQIRLLKHKDISENFLLDPRSTYSLEWT